MHLQLSLYLHVHYKLLIHTHRFTKQVKTNVVDSWLSNIAGNSPARFTKSASNHRGFHDLFGHSLPT